MAGDAKCKQICDIILYPPHPVVAATATDVDQLRMMLMILYRFVTSLIEQFCNQVHAKHTPSNSRTHSLSLSHCMFCMSVTLSLDK